MVLALDAFLLWPVDHPLVGTDTVRALVKARTTRAARIVVPVYKDTPGHPTLFAADLAPEIVGAPDSEGARYVVHRHDSEVQRVEVEDSGVVADIDSPEDFQRWLG